MIIANIRYNKTTFLEKWRRIIKDHKVGDKLVTANLAFVQGACKLSEEYRRIAYSAKFQAKIGSLKFGPKGKQRDVKGIMVRAMGYLKYIFISQQDIMRELFPPANDTARERENRAEILKMMRQQIAPQIDDFKEAWQKRMDKLKEEDIYEYHEEMKCPLSGKDLRKSDIAIDHDPPFIELAEEFFRLNGIDPYTELVIGSPYKRRFERQHLNTAWKEYHRKHARLQATDATENLKKGAKATEDYNNKRQLAAQAKKQSPRFL